MFLKVDSRFYVARERWSARSDLRCVCARPRPRYSLYERRNREKSGASCNTFSLVNVSQGSYFKSLNLSSLNPYPLSIKNLLNRWKKLKCLSFNLRTFLRTTSTCNTKPCCTLFTITIHTHRLYVVVSLDFLFDRYGKFSPYIALPYENSTENRKLPQASKIRWSDDLHYKTISESLLIRIKYLH